MSVPAASIPDARDDAPHEDAIVVLPASAWADYQRLLGMRGDRSAPRIAFLDGVAEILSPSFEHERIKSTLGGLVEAWCLFRGTDVIAVGAWTQQDEAKSAGVEPDECYIIGEQRKERPDLAIEVVWTSGGLDKLEIYRRLGIREVWTWRKGALHVHVLRDDGYREVSGSEVLVGIDLQQLLSFLDRPSLTRAQRDYLQALERSMR